MRMKVTKITVLTETTGTDKVGLYLDLPTPYPAMSREAPDSYPPCATVDAQSGHGEEWARTNFPGVPLEILNCKTGTRTTIWP